MTKFIIQVTQGQNRTAGTKAKADVVDILKKDGFKVINYQIASNKYMRVLTSVGKWKKLLCDVQPGDQVFYQYPAYSRYMGDQFIREVRNKKAIPYLILHDVNSLRMYINSSKDSTREIAFFNKFDGIIAHNDTMKKWLEEHNINVRIVSLQIFDYLADYDMDHGDLTNTVAYTGNLEKSTFLKKLEIDTPISLYGINPQIPYPAGISYRGSFDSDELGDTVKESFGLVWDGDSITTCSGVLGNYTRFNNPHKTSFYLSKGMPVIIWNQAALAKFIVDNDCGISIGSLKDLDKSLTGLSSEKKMIMKNNAIQIGQKIRRGYYLITAINSFDSKIYQNNYKE